VYINDIEARAGWRGVVSLRGKDRNDVVESEDLEV
jgi:hypothetical protein